MYLSPIFRWFDDDFVEVYGTDAGFVGHSGKKRAVLNFVSGHVGDPDGRYLREERYALAFEDYDWSLNEQE